MMINATDIEIDPEALSDSRRLGSACAIGAPGAPAPTHDRGHGNLAFGFRRARCDTLSWL
jgi:hypothetical protein